MNAHGAPAGTVLAEHPVGSFLVTSGIDVAARVRVYVTSNVTARHATDGSTVYAPDLGHHVCVTLLRILRHSLHAKHILSAIIKP